MSERLQKYLARAGVASRRHAETLIVEGRVKVNSQVVTTLGTKVEPGRDLVTVDGKLVEAEAARAHYLFYKPPGVVTTLSDPQGRPSISSFTQPLKLRLFPVGRLDYDAEGALLLTDDGQLAYELTHPRFQVPRTYLAKVKGAPDEATLERLRGGVRLEDGFAKPTSVEIFEKAEKNTWLKIVVTEGRQHLVKRLCAAIGHPVVRLFRPHYAGLTLEGLRPGALRPLTADEVKKLQAAVKGAAAGPEPELRLPARRHGHGTWGDGEAAEDAPPPVPKPPRFNAPKPGDSRRGDSRRGPAHKGPRSSGEGRRGPPRSRSKPRR
jgi:23S rRNA pseudouridine2605 synthase